MNVGDRIRFFREKSQLSQNMLADKAGISQTHLRRVELGQAGITVDHLEMICDAFNITLKDFFDIEASENEFETALSKLTPKQKRLLLDFIKCI